MEEDGNSRRRVRPLAEEPRASLGQHQGRQEPTNHSKQVSQSTCDKQTPIFEALHLLYVKRDVNMQEKASSCSVFVVRARGGKRLQRGSGVTGAQRELSGCSQPQIIPRCQMEQLSSLLQHTERQNPRVVKFSRWRVCVDDLPQQQTQPGTLLTHPISTMNLLGGFNGFKLCPAYWFLWNFLTFVYSVITTNV